MNRVYNFSAGPGMLPLPVLEQAQRDLTALPGVGMSVLEISHRSKAFDTILAEAEADLRALLGVPDGYKVLFLQGGASLQFSMVPMNLLRGRPAAYLVTGSWGSKAVKEAQKEGEAKTVWSGKDANFVGVPKTGDYTVPDGAAYLHFTSNETIQGVEFHAEPGTGGAALVCDMSSNFLSKPVDVAKYDLIYAGAQKNAGPAGVTVVILKESLLEGTPENLPVMLDYKIQSENGSRYNTPPVFGIYMVGLVAKWLRGEIGGLDAVARLNAAKAKVLYDALDGSDGFYEPHAEKDARSNMNVTFRLADKDLEKTFLAEAEKKGLFELKGHRLVGGFRASIYNAMPREGVEALADFLGSFRAARRAAV